MIVVPTAKEVRLRRIDGFIAKVTLSYLSIFSSDRIPLRELSYFERHPLRALCAARDRYDTNKDYWEQLAKKHTWRLGLDVGDGGDPHALAIWRGPVLYEVQIHPTLGDLLDTDRAADIADENMRSLAGHCEIAVDSTGVAAGTLAKLIRMGRMARACRFGDGAKNPKMFTNHKAELFWEFREALRNGVVVIAPLENEDYVESAENMFLVGKSIAYYLFLLFQQTLPSLKSAN